MPDPDTSVTPPPTTTGGLWSAASGPAMPGRERVVALHGFTQTHRAWDPLAATLATRGTAFLAVDLPGHGRSSSVSADLWGTADLVADVLPDPSTPVTLVGYSMGGRVALHLAVALAAARLERLSRLVLVGATAGIDDERERTERRAADDQLATRLEEIGIDAFLGEWLRGPLFASLPPELAGIEHRRANTVAGLADSLRRCGTGTQTPLWDRLHTVRCRVSVVVGGRDEKFQRLGSRLVDALPDAELLVVEGAGHACHLEDPDQFAALVYG